MLEESTDAEVNLDFQKVLSNNNVSYRSFKSNMGWTIQREQSSANPKKKLEEWVWVFISSVFEQHDFTEPEAVFIHYVIKSSTLKQPENLCCLKSNVHSSLCLKRPGQLLLNPSLMETDEKPVVFVEQSSDRTDLVSLKASDLRPNNSDSCCSLGSQAVVSVCFQHVMQHHRRQTEQPVKPKSCKINEGTFDWLFSEWWRSSSGSEWNSVEFVVIL